MRNADDGLAQPITDPVTGVYPRALLKPRMAAELSRAARTGAGCSVFLFDVDFFKTVNDTYGHLRGDEVLRQIAERVTGAVRPSDELFRYGGDEFVLLLSDTGRTEAVRLALGITEDVRGREFPGQPPLHVSVSLGVATFPDDGTDATELLACADRRNYLAKARGRGCAVADDADTGAGATPTSSRLWERTGALANVHEFLTKLMVMGRGSLAVVGQPGAGHTRFLDEVAAIAKLRGFDVRTVADGSRPDEPASAGGCGVVMLADLDAAPHLPVAVERLTAAGDPGLFGVVYATSGEPLATGLPALGEAELAPWSPGAVRIWLRTALQGEPSQSLVNWVTGQSGGLPGRVAGELERLRARGGLVPADNGGWTLSSVAAGGQRRLRRLPVPVTELVGRQSERSRVGTMLAGGRLVTLLGPGGIGKTRLALAVAATASRDLTEGAVFVPLADTTEPDQVVAEIAAALEVEPAPGQSLLDSVTERLADASLLLVLDNFEQVLGAAAIIGELLAAGPEVKVLVTSRERLSVYGERVYHVPPLPLPDLDTLGTGSEAVARASMDFPALALFEQRAQDADPEFTLSEETLPAVAGLCRLLDGLPLAIELAAARFDRWNAQQLLTHLSDHLHALGEGPRDLPSRQQSLSGAIDWSVRLLDPQDQQLFTALAVFVGGCTAHAALAVAGGGAGSTGREEPAPGVAEMAASLAALAGKSLLVAETDPDGVERYRMLETIRAYALARLAEGGQTDAVRGRHLEHFAGYAERAGAELAGPHQVEWINRVECDYQNLRTAFGAAMHDGDVDGAARLCLGVWRYWTNGHYIQDGRDWLEQLLEHRRQLGHEAAGQLLYAAALVAAEMDDNERARTLAGSALEEAESAGDRPAVAKAHLGLGHAAIGLGEHQAAADHYRLSLQMSQELGRSEWAAIALGNLAAVALEIGDIDGAEGYAHEALPIERAAGNTRNVVLTLEKLIQVRLIRGDASSARKTLEESVVLSRQLGAAFEAMALYQLGCAMLLEGDREEALRVILDVLDRRRPMGDSQHLAMVLDSLANVVSTDRAELAAELLGAADGVRRRRRLPVPPAVAAQREQTLAAIRTQLDEEALVAARTAGRTAPLELVAARAQDAARVAV
jgi:diguanylate cyclase (GGDEF)-like protein